jgi:NADPH:quinone reductase-like Zn-dependent oxidoreductase
MPTTTPFKVTMKRIQYHRYGGLGELRLEEFELPQLGPHQVRVQVKAAGLNPMDLGIPTGRIKTLTGSKFPRGLGHDFAGVVLDVGAQVTQFKIGDKVFGGTGLKEAGCFSEQVIANDKDVWIKPSALSFEEAGSMCIVSFTAWTGLVTKAKLKAGQSVFIAGGLGGVGRAATQIALLRGAAVVVSCGASRRDEALAMGVAEAVDYVNFDAGKYRGRFDVVFDTHASLSEQECEVMLKQGGVAVHLDFSFSKMLRYMFSRRHIMIVAKRTPEAVSGILEAAQQGKLAPAVGNKVPLSQAIQAILEFQKTGLPRGKLVVVP